MNLGRAALAFTVVSVLAFATPAVAQNSLTFQGVTFETLASGNTLQLTITNALSGGTGNWSNVNYLKAFEIKDVGNVTGASLAGWRVDVEEGLSSAAGCETGGTPGACFYSPTAVALTDRMTFTIRFTGTNLNFDAPHLKIQFLTGASDSRATGDLLSQTIPAVPEPEIYAMMAVGLGLMGFVARRRKLHGAMGA